MEIGARCGLPVRLHTPPEEVPVELAQLGSVSSTDFKECDRVARARPLCHPPVMSGNESEVVVLSSEPKSESMEKTPK